MSSVATGQPGLESGIAGFGERLASSAGVRGVRFRADFDGSSSAEIGWDLWGTLPQFLPRESHQRRPAISSARRSGGRHEVAVQLKDRDPDEARDDGFAQLASMDLRLASSWRSEYAFAHNPAVLQRGAYVESWFAASSTGTRSRGRSTSRTSGSSS